MRALFVAVAGLAAAAYPALLCEVPVFRYALERWESDPFEIVVLHHGGLDEDGSALVKRLEAAIADEGAPLNAKVTVLEAGDPGQPPRMHVRFPPDVDTDPLGWEGAFDEANVDALIDSPLRGRIARRILEGESAVWVFIESGEEGADRAALGLLQRELERLEKTLKLPSIEDIRNDAFYQPDTVVKLKLSFAIERLRRDDPAERVFRSLLLRSERDLESRREPIAIPVFGRGRTYFALVGKGIKPTMIEENCRFLVGPCSCQAKEENPGADLPFSVNWAKRIKGSAIPDRPLPDLSGVGDPPAPEAGAGDFLTVGVPILGVVMLGVLVVLVAGFARTSGGGGA